MKLLVVHLQMHYCILIYIQNYKTTEQIYVNKKSSLDQIATISNQWLNLAELLLGILFVASPVVLIYLQLIQDQTLVQSLLHHVPNKPFAAIHPPPLQSPPLKEYYHRVQVGVAMARDADSIQH